MAFNMFFSSVIYFFILLVAICIIKVYVYNIEFHTIGEKKYDRLLAELNDKKNKGQVIKAHISLANSFEISLFHRFFVIHKELMELQKLLFKL
jgi:hypothetical protein